MKQARFKRLCAVQFNSYEILETAKLKDRTQNMVSHGWSSMKDDYKGGSGDILN